MSNRIDEYSFSTVPLQKWFNTTELGKATGFAWRKNEKEYLITNWHVVSGRNSETGSALAAHAGEPNRIIAQLRAGSRLMDVVPLGLPLRDENSAPLWLCHPVYKRKVDVVAIPLTAPRDKWVTHPINQLSRQDQLSVQVGMDVFVLGYPFGASHPSLPVWKRGSIATEPNLVHTGDNFFLIDSASRPGMSGAPVIMRSYGAHLTESGTSITTAPATKFLGVYSGRLHTSDAEDAQLGRVWPQSLIIEIIDANVRDPDDRT